MESPTEKIDTPKPPEGEDVTKDLAIMPTQRITIADMETYRSWIDTETKALMVECDEASDMISDNASMATAVELGRELKGKLKKIIDKVDSQICAERKRRWQEGNTFRRSVIPPLEEMLERVEKSIGTFKQVQERKRQAEEEARLAEIKRREEEEARIKRKREEEEARRKAEYARQKLEAEVNHAWDQALQHDDWVNKERARRDQEAAEKLGWEKREEEARLDHVVAAVDAGRPERGEAILETQTPLEPAPEASKPIPKPAPLPEPEPVPKPEPLPPEEPKPAAPLPIVNTPAVPKVEGAIHKVKWTGEITNVKDLMKWVLESGMSSQRLLEEMEAREQPFLINYAWVNTKARKLKDQTKIPGIKAVPERDTKLRV